MAFKFIAILSLIAAANAGAIQVPQHAPLEHEPSFYQHIAPHHQVDLQKYHAGHEDYPADPHPKYNFEYTVDDAVSGDSKSQIESRDGDVVQGEYTLIDADGFRRTVKYTADDINGFNAVVHREPIEGHKRVTIAHPGSVESQYHHTATAYVVPTAAVKTHVASYAAPVNLHAHPEQAPPAYNSYELPHQESSYHH